MRWKFRLRSYNGAYHTTKLYTEQKSVRGALDWRVGQRALFNNSSNSDIPFHLPRASLLMEQRQPCIIRQQSPSLNKLHISQIFEPVKSSSGETYNVDRMVEHQCTTIAIHRIHFTLHWKLVAMKTRERWDRKVDRTVCGNPPAKWRMHSVTVLQWLYNPMPW